MSLRNVTNTTARIVGENTSSWFDPPDRIYDDNGKRIPFYYSGSGCNIGARSVGRPSVSETDGVHRAVGSKSAYYAINAGVNFKAWHRDNETSWFLRLFE